MLHNFHVGGLGQGLTLELVPETRALMRINDLLLRKVGTEYHVLYGRESWRASNLAQIKTAIGLRFILKSENPGFLNITELPLDRWHEERLYFHNLRLPEGDIHFLSQNNTIGAADLAPPARLPCDIVRGLSDLPLTLLPQDPPKPIFSLGLAPPDIPCSWADFGVSPGDLGIVDIFIGRAAMMLNPPVDMAAPAVVPNYRLHFEARHTRWRYYLMNQEGPLPETVQITDPNSTPESNPLALEDEGTRTLPGTGQTARIFSLKEPAALAERPDRRLKLQYTLPPDPARTNGNNGSIDLPVPNGQKISPQMDSAGMSVFSDLFIYL